MTKIYKIIGDLRNRFEKMCYGLTNDKNIVDDAVQELMLYFLQMNPETLKKIYEQDGKEGIVKYGAVAIPMHMAMWNMSYNLAKKFEIPYILWGENSANEYGGSKKDRKLKFLNANWVKKYGVNFNTTAEDWISESLSIKDLAPFIKEKPSHNKKEPKSIFLGDYFKWDPIETYREAKKSGFVGMKKAPKIGIYRHTDIDDNLISIHHFLKIYKFGFSRSYDNLSLEIRNKRISRRKAIEIIRKEKFKKPINDIKLFCRFINITTKKFYIICEKFRNKNIWIFKKNKWRLKYPLS